MHLQLSFDVMGMLNFTVSVGEEIHLIVDQLCVDCESWVFLKLVSLQFS